MSENEDNAVTDLAALAPAGHPPRFFKLSGFWTASPAAWFGVAEAQFLLRSTTTQQDHFPLVATVLHEASARRVAYILTTPGATAWMTSGPLAW